MSDATVGFQVLPNGKDVDTHGILEAVVNVVKEADVKYDIGPMETVMEGRLPDLLEIVSRAQQVAIDEGASEAITNVKIHYRPSGITLDEKKSF
jgi:uncharacterized protein YqgV (UPF0045/DUF77 family)